MKQTDRTEDRTEATRLDRFLKTLYRALKVVTSWLEDEYEMRPKYLTCPDCGAVVERTRAGH